MARVGRTVKEAAAVIHFITPEFPPILGGVGDYTAQVARGLELSGHPVRVWCLGQSLVEGVSPCPPAEGIGAGYSLWSLWKLGRKLNRFPLPRRLMVQWVPHGYGWHSMNVPFCLWTWWRSRWHKDAVELFVHEACLPFGFGSWKTDIAAFVHRLMAIILLAASSRIWVTIPEWERILRPFSLGRNIPFGVLPVPSNIPVVDDQAAIQRVREKYVRNPGQVLVGHFSRHNEHIKTLLRPVIPAVLNSHPERIFLLIGQGGEEFRRELLAMHPELGSQLWAIGQLASRDVSLHISACDLLLEPYADGICGRHGAAIGVLSHGKAMVTTSGAATEPFWNGDAAVEMVDANDHAAFVQRVEALAADASRRRIMEREALRFYRENLDIQCLLDKLQAGGSPCKAG